MRKLITIFLVCACVLLTTTAARGQFIISLDENGNGNVNYEGVITTLTSGVDTPPIGHATLYYILPLAMVEGDVKVIECGLSDTISDVLRFSGSRVYVYSDGGDNDLADTGIPTQLMSNMVEVKEVGTENGWTGVPDYTPASGQPGYDPYPGGPIPTYNFTSDVPEPATIALLGLGALGLLRRKR